VAKDDKIFRVKGDDEIITVAPEYHQPFRKSWNGLHGLL
jgi:hypothetical protein